MQAREAGRTGEPRFGGRAGGSRQQAAQQAAGATVGMVLVYWVLLMALHAGRRMVLRSGPESRRRDCH